MLECRDGDKVIRICDECGDRRLVNYWNVYKKEQHLCYSCSNSKTNLGKTPWNKGKKFEPKSVGNIYMSSDNYPQVWVGKDKVQHGYMAAHRLVASDALGRLVTPDEKVHHINSDRSDYSPNNLYVCKDMSHHRKVHAQLEVLAMGLVSCGAIAFNQSSGEYYLSRPMEKFIEEELGELLETPNEKDEGNQQPSSVELIEKVQRLFRKEVQPK